MPGRERRNIPRSAVFAASLAGILVAVGLGLRVLDVLPAAGPLPQRLASMLIAAGAICVVGLTIRRATVVAWISTVIAGWVAAIELVGIARGWQPFADADAWPWLAALAGFALLSEVAIAGAYAAAPRPERQRLEPAIRLFVSAGFLAVLGGAGWAILRAFQDADAAIPVALLPVRIASRLALALIAAFAVIGVARDLAQPIARSRERLRSSTVPGGGRGGPDGGRGRPIEFLRLLGDELFPGGAASLRRGVEQERARLAADLHAFVLPDLRRAAATAETSHGLPDPLAVGLRIVVDDVEGLMHARQSIVLEEFGLVAALEWLVEWTEERSDVRATLELEGDVIQGVPAATAPRPVERAFFRVALLALDNVVRHAEGSTARVLLATTAEGLRLEITDDGRAGDRRGANAGAAPGRGLADMRSEAVAVGGALTIVSSDPGTRVELAWPAPRKARGTPASTANCAARLPGTRCHRR